MIESARRFREIRTPEGVLLPFEIAGRWERGIAFVIDMTIVALLIFAIEAGVGFVISRASSAVVALSLTISFIIRNFYFTIAELRRNGSTFGKKFVGVRVISRDGGPLSPSAVFARNLTREIEIFLPLVALVNSSALFPNLPGWGAILGVLWLVVFAILPLLNRDGLRVGDVLAGTMVVRLPRTKLLQDVVEMAETESSRGDVSSEHPIFSDRHLDQYGIRELHVLERLLRRESPSSDGDVLEAVARKIKRKIAWSDEQGEFDDRTFLTAFYKAQRAYLERGLLFGKRRERKRDAASDNK